MKRMLAWGAAAAMLGYTGYGVAQKTVASISASDKRAGAAAHPDLLKEYGGAYAGPQAAYVTSVGRRIAVQSGLSDSQRDFTITLLDSPVNNAFAIPGGYVYVTRQLLALANDEAELASVLGHEVGHVAARHSNKRSNTSTLTQVLAAAIGGITGSSGLANLAGGVAQLYTLRFSRDQEYQADTLGVRYLAGAGYDPYASSTMLAALGAQGELDQRIKGQDARSLPTWASTHPNSADRVKRAEREAAKAGVAPGQGARNRDAFLAAIDGTAYDDNPAQGLVEGRSFRHPVLKLQFTVPEGYVIGNGADAVSISGNGGQAQFSGVASDASPAAYVDRIFARLGGGNAAIDHDPPRTTRINGIDAAYATGDARLGSGRSDVTVVAYQFTPGTYYHFILVTPAGAGIGPFGSLVQSMARLSAAEAARIKGRRVAVVTVKAGDTIDSLSQRMGFDTLRKERFLVLNALDAGSVLRPGQKVKLIVLG